MLYGGHGGGSPHNNARAPYTYTLLHAPCTLHTARHCVPQVNASSYAQMKKYVPLTEGFAKGAGYGLGLLDFPNRQKDVTGKAVNWTSKKYRTVRVCPKGADCSVAGARTATITTLPNFWRASTSTSYFDTLSCAPDTCVGGTFSVSVSTGSQCAVGQSGLMCSVCDTSKRYARHLGAKCIKCSGTATEELLKIVGGICALIIGSLMVFIIIIKPLLRRLRKRMTLSQLRKAIYKRQMKIKILLSFVQGN
jgi:hypothetical protein